jgi:hypothetical protein
MANVVNRAGNEALVKDAYERVKAEWRKLDASQLPPQVNLDLQLALQTILGALPEMKTLRQRMAELPGFDVAQFDKLEDHTLGLMFVQARFMMATQPPSDLAELIGEAERLRTLLFADARTLAVRVESVSGRPLQNWRPVSERKLRLRLLPHARKADCRCRAPSRLRPQHRQHHEHQTVSPPSRSTYRRSSQANVQPTTPPGYA